jgi:hypothetical protein
MHRPKPKLSERPLESNEIRKQPILYRFNRIRGQIDDLLYKDAVAYHFLNSEESLTKLIRSQKSYIRFGDAEAKLMLGGNWPTQIGSRELRRKLYLIFHTYSEESPFLIGLANSRICRNREDLKRIDRDRVWRNSRFLLRRLLKHKQEAVFLEANMFRVGQDELRLQKIEALWKSLQHVIIVHNNETSLNWFRNHYPGIEAHLVKIPDKNMFAVVDQTEESILDLISKHKMDPRACAILLAAGAGGNVLNYNLCQHQANSICYDMGNFFHMQVNRKHVLSVLEAKKRAAPGY